MTLDTFVTVTEVATRLRLSRMTVYRMVDRGDFPGAIRTGVNGKTIRIPEAALAHHLASATSATWTPTTSATTDGAPF